MQEKHKIEISQYQEKLRKFERDNLKYQEKLIEYEKSKSGSTKLLEKRLKEALLNEKEMTLEILSLKKNRDETLLKMQRKIDEERDKWRMKLFHVEQILKESENKRQSAIFEFEKEKTRWSIENSQLMSQQTEYLEQIDRLLKKKEFM